MKRVAAIAIVILLAGVSAWAMLRRDLHGTGAQDSDKSGSGDTPLFPVEIRRPDGPPRVRTDLLDARGQELSVSCSSCHATRPPNGQNRTSADLDEFHQGLTIQHGGLSCISCHNAHDYDSLRLADGTRVEFLDVMKLCAQCHGPQFRDYQNGSHGGMTGFWDRTRGPRQRNNCVDCHDPHAPAYGSMLPVPPPRDRFLGRDAHN